METGIHYPLRLDALPRGWRAGYVGDFAREIEPGFASGDHNQTGDGVAHLRPMNIDREGKIDLSVTKFVSANKDDRRLAVGDVLFNNTNSPELVGKTAVLNVAGDFAFSNHMTRIRFGEDVLPKFGALQLHFLWMRGYFKYNCVKHVNQASVSSRALARGVPFVWAPPAHQERIVAEIEKQFSRLEDALTSIRAVRARLSTYLRSILAGVQTGALCGLNWEEWPRRSIGELAAVVQYGTSAKVSAAEKGIPVLRMGNIENGRLVLDELKYLPAGHEEFPALLLEPGDVLFNRTNSPELVGKSAVYKGNPTPCSFASYLIRIRLRESVEPDFVAYVMNSPYGRAWVRSVVSQQVGQANVNGSKLKAFQLGIPPIGVQRALVAEAERHLSLIRNADAQLAAIMMRAERLRTGVLSRAFSRTT